MHPDDPEALRNRPPALADGGTLAVVAGEPWSLAAALDRAVGQCRKNAIVYVRDDHTEIATSYGDLRDQARRILGGLREVGLRPGDYVVVHLQDNQEILGVFWGCVRGGFIPVIFPVPASYVAPSRLLDQLLQLVEFLHEPLIVTTAALREAMLRDLKRPAIDAGRIAAVETLREHSPEDVVYPARPDDVAMLSLTSGSTGTPKYIPLTQRNLLARASGANQLCAQSASDRILNWLPLDHIASISDWHVRCVLLGCGLVYAPKEYVLAQPLRWLDLLAKHRITHSWAPNFAYRLVNDAMARMASRGDTRTWDLSCVEGLLTAGETVSATVVEDFLRSLAPHGLRATAIRPAFGMAEMGSGVTYFCPSEQSPLRVHTIARPSVGERVVRVSPGSAESVAFVGLGKPIPGMSVRIADAAGQTTPEETIGHVQFRGQAVSTGYLQAPQANHVFHADGWFETGDLGFLADGHLVLTGRAKEMIVVNGANYYCREIEEAVEVLDGVERSFTAVCAVRPPGGDSEQVAIFFHAAAADDAALADLLRGIRRQVVQRFGIRAEYLLPVAKEVIPKTAIGKLQRHQLQRRFEAGEFSELLERVASLSRRASAAAGPQALPQNDAERQLAEIWRAVLNADSIGRSTNLFELGADSLRLAQAHARLVECFGPRLSLVDMFQYPTVEAMARFLAGGARGAGELSAAERGRQRAAARRAAASPRAASAVAVIGMACRFPGAGSPEQLWNNLCAGVESISFFSPAQVLAAGIDPSLVDDPAYVRAGGVLPDIEQFDAEFFGYSAREAAMMDPQQRLFLECAWEAMEHAGYNPHACRGSVGVFAGAVLNTYLLNNLRAGCRRGEARASGVLSLDSLDGFHTMVASDKDYLPTRVSYRLNLRGPSVNVQTACSTSLVAIHLAAQSLLGRECDMALAGGVSIKVPQETGYLYQSDLIVSPDGHCRAFDADAGGTIFGNGLGIVVLKRLEEALADRDRIYAVIRGSAVNNDGAAKVGFFAPSQDGQAAVAAEALAAAGVDADSIGMVEMHGTGTALGDPIEIAGMTQAFRAGTSRSGFCAAGSIKTNLGHMQIASGVAGFIKTALALFHGQIPPSLHFWRPNPKIDFASTPFYVNTRLSPWSRGDAPRRASVNSLGIGGTNAHMVLEEPPVVPAAADSLHRPLHLLALSARNRAALHELAARYLDFFDRHPDLPLADVCFTANTGRASFDCRLAVVAAGTDQLHKRLAAWTRGDRAAGVVAGEVGPPPRVALVFSGAESQYGDMAGQLYHTQPTFRRAIDRCDAIVRASGGRPLRPALHLETEGPAAPSATIEPAVAWLAVQYALLELWRSWGIQPAAVAAYRSGRYAAACAAGVMELEDALRLAAAGAASIAEHLTRATEQVAWMPPRIPMLCDVTGRLAGEEIATPEYWRRQGQQPVPPETLVQALVAMGCDVLVEIGPRPVVLSQARRVIRESKVLGLPSLGARSSAWDRLLRSLARLHVRGAAIDWTAFDAEYARQRLPLPTYPFQRQRHWIEPHPVSPPAEQPGPVEPAAAGPGRYRIEWRERPRSDRPRAGQLLSQQPSTWILLADAQGLARALAERLRSRQARCLLVVPAGEAQGPDDSCRSIDPECKEDYRRLLAEAAGDPAKPLCGIVDLWSLRAAANEVLTTAALRSAETWTCGCVLYMLQALLESGNRASPRFWLLTRGAAAVGDAPAAVALAQSPAWGFAQAVALEHPEFWGGAVDLAADSGEESLDAVTAELCQPDEEDHVAYRQGRRYAARLVPAANVKAPPPRFRAEGSYLIAGGLGALGLHAARWLQRHGAKHLVLLGRHGAATPQQQQAVRGLEQSGCTVRVVRADVADERSLARLFAGPDAFSPPLAGVIQAAGVAGRKPIATMDRGDLSAVLAAKVAGGWLLDRAARQHPLDFFLCFSSAASVWGSIGHGHYAAANAFLDALAHHRRAAGQPALTVNWGPWSGEGMAGADPDTTRHLEQMGVRAMAPGEALEALPDCMAAADAQCVVASVDWSRFCEVYQAKGRRPLVELLEPQPQAASCATVSDAGTLPEALRAAAPRDRRELVRTWVCQEITAILGCDLSDGQEERGFAELGLDSLGATELKNRLEKLLQRRLPVALAFNYPCARALIDYLCTNVLELPLAAPAVSMLPRPAAGLPPPPDASGREDIAIIGLSGRFPQGEDIENFWRFLRGGGDAVREIPLERWDINRYFHPDPDRPGKTYSRSGSFLDGVDRFDAQLFHIAPREAAHIDPQQRLLLEVGWEAMERAGLPIADLAGSRTGVFVGIGPSDYHEVHARDWNQREMYVETGSAICFAAGRLAYTFGFQGPALVVDTACSSSLVAVHLACQSLLNRECELALAAGVNLVLTPRASILLSRARALSRSGRCRTFDAAADGYVRGEGCGVVVLKPLSRALADGDPLLAVIRGSAVNHDGRTSGLTVPNGPAQEAVLRHALARAGLSAEELDYVEAHGTGTPLGDPIELEAIGAVCRGRRGDRPLLVGTVKTNIGHLEAAAGIAGLIKVVLALEHEELPAHLHFHQPSPNVRWADLPLRIVTQAAPWRRGERPRRAGVSAFGFSGTNAHLVLEEPPLQPAEAGTVDGPWHVLAISARSPEALRALAERYVACFRQPPHVSLGDACYTAGAGRSHLPYRLAVVAASVSQARERLEAFCSGQESGGIFHGKACANRPGDGEAVANAVCPPAADDPSGDDALRIAEGLAAQYVQGAPIDWQAVMAGRRKKVVLPTYPFQRDRYWLEAPAEPGAGPPPGAELPLGQGHPLLGQRFASAGREVVFQGRIGACGPPFLGHHLLSGVPVLPAAAYLEAMLAAARQVFPAGRVAVRDVVFEQPLFLPAGQVSTVQSVLSPEGAAGYAAQLFSLDDSGDAAELWRRHASARLVYEGAGGPQPDLALPDVAARCPESLPVEEIYRYAAARGLEFGPMFRGLQSVRRGVGEVLAEISLPEVDEDLSRYQIHPALLDACFQAVAVLCPQADRDVLYLPVGVERFWMEDSPGTHLWSHIRPRPGGDNGTALVADVALLDGRGRRVGAVEGLQIRPLRPASLRGSLGRSSRDWLYEIQWREDTHEPDFAGAAPSEAGDWLIFADRGGIADSLVQFLSLRQKRCLLVEPGQGYEKLAPDRYVIHPGRPGDFRSLLNELSQQGSPCHGIVFLWGIAERGPEGGEGEGLPRYLEAACGGALHLVQALASSALAPPRLWLVTQGGQAVGSAAPDVRQASLWGLGRTIAREYPEWRLVQVDLDPAAGPHGVEWLWREVSSPDGEDQVAYRDGRRYVARLARHEGRTSPAGTRQHPFRLEISQFGSLDALAIVPAQRRPPQAHEVEIAVRAAGLNFRDVLRALGMLREHEPWAAPETPLGLECSGTIAAVGRDVQGFQVGQEVLALAPWCLGSHVTVAAGHVAAKPAQLSLESAAALPVAQVTACYALGRLGRLAAGERVLIHAAAGGVGQAAVQWARHVGAEIFATAHPSKWDALRAQGIADPMSSRNLDFAEEVMRRTGGRGVDVVLNSFPGEFIPKGLAVLAPGGRFLEIGKLGIWDSDQVARLRPDVQYFPFDLNEEERRAPGTMASLLREVTERLASGAMGPLPHRVFAVEDAAAAFRYVAQSRHVGKVVLSLGQPPAEAPKARIRKDGSYLVTGGLGALGLATARWLADQGAGHLVLVGRRGVFSDQAQQTVSELERSARVTVLPADVASAADMQRVFQRIAASGLPLRGVVHAAGVLDDAMLARQTWERFLRVLEPKVLGAWNLHELTRGSPLDFFICYSSSSSVLGSAGQGNYAAANAFLDALCHLRQSGGMCGTSVNWGPWAQAGMAAALGERGQTRLRALGFTAITPRQAMDALERVLEEQPPQVAVMPVNWRQWTSQVPACLLWSDFQPADAGAKASRNVLEQLRAAPAADRRDQLRRHVAAEVSRILGLPATQAVAADEGFIELGMDSLTALELRNRLQGMLGISLPSTLIFDYPTLEALVDHLAQEAFASETPRSVPRPAPGADKDELANLSEEELAALLGQRLSKLKGMVTHE
jgi:acyl transferase domain-containing protein/acyl-CoA synthetase (AMP-forming)/AMP-acid ligase II/NADPH:quinone reductase-like Zn-dependent oxidoreductase/acyl carrier protein